MFLPLFLALVAVVRGKSVHFCPPTFVDCSCGDEENHSITIALNTTSIIDPATGVPRCVVIGDPLQVCESRKCVIIPNDHFEVLFKKGKIISPSNSLDESGLDFDALHAHKNASADSMNPFENMVYPMQFTYPRSARVKEGRLSREERARRECKVPNMENAQVTCWKWPNWQSCKQECIYGYGIQTSSGTLTEMTYNCRNSENKWKPRVMNDCKPYLNCRVALVSPGDLKCVEPGKRPAYCDIECGDYDDNPAEKQKFVCSYKTKEVRLPHCVVLENNDNLIPPPS